MVNKKSIEKLNKTLIKWGCNYQVYECDGYTIEELLMQFFHKINEVVDIVIEYTSIISALKEWIEDEGLKEIIYDKIDEMIDNGTISNMLDDKLIKMYENFNEFKNSIRLEYDNFVGDTEKRINRLSLGFNSPFYDFDTEQYRDDVSETTYWITKIPYMKDGEKIKLNVGIAKHFEDGSCGKPTMKTSIYDHEYNEKARDFSIRKNASLCINAGIWDVKSGDFIEIGNTIIDGKIIHSNIKYPQRWSCCIDENGILSAYRGNFNACQLIKRGVKNCVTGFVPIIMDYQEVGNGVKSDYMSGWETRAPRQVICQDRENNYIIFTSTGRFHNEKGMTLSDVVRLLQIYDIRFAFNLDGGGSTSLIKKHTLINKLTDDRGVEERPCYSFMYVNKEIKNEKDKDLNSIYERMGEIEEKLRRMALSPINYNGYSQLIPQDNWHYQGIEVWDDSQKVAKLQTYKDSLGYFDYELNKHIFNVDKDGDIRTVRGIIGDYLTFSKPVNNLNTLKRSGIYWATKDTTGVPSAISYGILNIQVGSEIVYQLAFPYTGTGIKKRRIIKDVPTEWENI